MTRSTCSLGGFDAELFCDPRLQPPVFHYIVTRRDTAEILAWGQEHSEDAALQAARDVMEDLDRREGRAAAAG